MRKALISILVTVAAGLMVGAPAQGAIVVSSVGSLTGLGMASTQSWASEPYDFTRDGRQDVVIVYHDEGMTWWRNDGGHFTAVQTTPLWVRWPDGRTGKVDRHGCAWGDANGDGRPDLYCTVGRTGFNMVKTGNIDNELWLQAADGRFQEVGSAWGVGDPYGRGRSATFVDANGDGRPDLYVANEIPRPNDPTRLTQGQNRLFINQGTRFVADNANAYGMKAFIGNGRRSLTFDFNGDGWQDVLVTGAARPYLYRNNAGHGFSEIGAAVGLKTAYLDIALGDVTGDGRPDIVGVTATAVLLQARTATGYAAPRTLASFAGGGESVALGDATGDGRLDIYVVRGGAPDQPDLLLTKNPDGSWARTSIPAVSSGSGYDVRPLRALPGRADFLVMNGMPDVGPITEYRVAQTAAAPVAPAATTPARYITYMFGRAQIGSYVAASRCTTPLPGNIPLWTVADLIKAHGYTATAPVTLNQTGTTAPVCQGTIRYATWADLTRLRTGYRWSLASRGRTGKELPTLTPTQQRDETCGTIPDFVAHGFPEAWGMFAYPNNKQTLALQTTLVNTCYGFGRRYGAGVNPVPVPYPYSAKTNSVMGGRCNNPALACYTLTVKNNRRYTLPKTLIGYENSAGWTIIQWYRFVTGKYGTMNTYPAWDCSSPNPANHWTTEPELYCFNDAHAVIDALAPGAIDTNPAAMAARQHRLGR